MTEAQTLKQWRSAVYHDISLLIRLHECEPNDKLLIFLTQSDFPNCLSLRLDEQQQGACLDYMRQGIAEFPAVINQDILDELAADFAAIYLNHSIQASPYESVWLDEDGLMHQQPMFEVRRWYRQYGLKVENWRQRSDDHLVYQLQFIAFLLKLDNDTETLAQIARFMDGHLLLWLKDFAGRVYNRAATTYYSALALLTATYVESLRDLMDSVFDIPRS